MNVLALFAASVTCVGLAQVAAGWLELHRFLGRRKGKASSQPAVTILKPLHGDEPMLEEALASFCAQDYPTLQIVFGLQDPTDPALAIVSRLRQRFPAVDLRVVVCGTTHGINRKIANLINMLPMASHDTLLIADSDMHVPSDYVRRVVDTLEQPGVGLVTSLYSGRPAFDGIAGWLGASYINHSFTPGALIGRLVGRRYCVGATMALRRGTLEAAGGLSALVTHLADDAVLGRLVGGLGLEVALAPTMPATTVPEKTIMQLFAHELRWARTVRCVAPIGFALAAVQFPFVWAALAILTSQTAAWSFGLFAIVWMLRYATSVDIDRALGLSHTTPVWLPPLRDLLSAVVMVASYTGTSVAWRGHILTSRTHPILHPATSKFVPGKGQVTP